MLVSFPPQPCFVFNINLFKGYTGPKTAGMDWVRRYAFLLSGGLFMLSCGYA